MKNSLYSFGLAAFYALAVMLSLTARAALTIEEDKARIALLVRNPTLEYPVLNPSGNWFAAAAWNEEEKGAVLVAEIGKTTAQTLGRKARDFQWVDDYRLDSGRDIFDVRRIGTSRALVGVPEELPAGFRPDSGYFRLARADLPVSKDLFESSGFARLKDGEVVYCVLEGEDHPRRLLRLQGRKWTECPVDLEEIEVLSTAASDSQLVVLGPRVDGGPRPIQWLDPVTGRLGAIIYRDPKRDCAGVVLRRSTREVSGIIVEGPARRIVWLDEAPKLAQQLVQRQFPGTMVRVVSTDVAEKRFLVEVVSDRQPPLFHLVEPAAKSLSLLKNSAPWIDPAKIPATQVLSFKTRDGLPLEALLTLPPGASPATPAPLIVEISGATWRERERWDWSVGPQTVAGAGFAVLRVNHRGVPGVVGVAPGDRFDAQKLSQDIIDGVHAALKTKLVDRQRVAVEGVGFGAYLALCGALEEPELYRCAAIFGGIYDWERAFAKKDSRNQGREAWLKARLKKHGKTLPSVLARAGEIKFPLLLVRNLDIADVTYESQIELLRDATKGRSVVFGDLNIWSIEEAKSEVVERLATINQFFANHLGAPPS